MSQPFDFMNIVANFCHYYVLKIGCILTRLMPLNAMRIGYSFIGTADWCERWQLLTENCETGQPQQSDDLITDDDAETGS